MPDQLQFYHHAVNEEEIPGVPDAPPPAVKKILKKAKKPRSERYHRHSKIHLKLNPNFQPLKIPSRDPEIKFVNRHKAQSFQPISLILICIDRYYQ